jgi:hypothetical protein
MSAETRADWLGPPTRASKSTAGWTLDAPHRVCAMDPTHEHGHEHEHHDEQGAEGQGANAAAPSTTSTTSLLGDSEHRGRGGPRADRSHGGGTRGRVAPHA